MTQNGYEVGVHGAQRESSGLFVHRGKMLVSGGPVELPAGSIGTSEIEPGACQQLIGSYVNSVNWTIPSANAWYETPIGVNCTFSGVTTRIEFNFLVASPVKGGRIYWAFYLDGNLAVGLSLGAVDAPEANYGAMATGTYYVMSSVSGTHRAAMGLHSTVAGVQIMAPIYSTLYVTEQRC